ncbi:hypothetical protein FHS18_005983 [Paenibacillus phyllosphaerae]|uniref:Uncharacterized protein n=1 Tax=Paenibacillus phyllosphaerae TaxID=274593 RepID=A0A7W5B3R0_9BACL|nr:hypothetical protein [Paenibacillus phyllosphaerae]MBB3113868.1 hypothetical protein [Paenibacillus phyllosphaerae]
MVTYSYDQGKLDIQESKDGEDTSFAIRVIGDDPQMLQGLKQVQRTFEENQDFDDVLFYAYPGHEYKIIVQQQYYDDFVTELFKARLLDSVARK